MAHARLITNCHFCAGVATACLITVISTASGMAQAEETADINRLLAPTFQTYCTKCHGAGDDVEADVNLLKLENDALGQNLELVRSLIDVLDLNEMPPGDESQPTPGLRRQMIAELQSILRNTISETPALPETPVRRMNRFQYNNAVTDLFDLQCVVFTLPERMMRDHKSYFDPGSGKMPDVVAVGNRPLGKSQLIERRLAGVAAFPQDLRAEHGFDNRGDHLSLSPLLMEAFLKLGLSITQSPDFGPKNVGIWKSFFLPPENDVDQDSEIRQRLKSFLFKAFRRPVDEELLSRYLNYVSNQLDAGISFTDAMKSVAAATLASPRFLYLYDNTVDAEAEQAASDFELATRLSFFLWESLPDQQLLNLAASGSLRTPSVLQEQLDRMLKDRKLKRFCDSFPSQWLQLERLISSVPHREKYPQFYFSKYRDSMHMMMEPLLLFETVLIENLPITELIDSSFTYRSGTLEDAYGSLATEAASKASRQGEVTVLNFHRVPVTDRRNGGVITNAAVMTMTSGPERTQPITRGAWVAGVIFNNPPEPPPADVPALGEKPKEGEEHLTLRERLALHRERSDCRGCHEQIDPLGFALENFDPIGVWREKYDNGRDIDMTGDLFRKHQFDDVIEFKDAILAEKKRFSRGLAGHLLSFALARELGAADQMALDEIVKATAADGGRMQTLLKQVVLSLPFRRERHPPEPHK